MHTSFYTQPMVQPGVYFNILNEATSNYIILNLMWKFVLTSGSISNVGNIMCREVNRSLSIGHLCRADSGSRLIRTIVDVKREVGLLADKKRKSAVSLFVLLLPTTLWWMKRLQLSGATVNDSLPALGQHGNTFNKGDRDRVENRLQNELLSLRIVSSL